MSEPDCILLWCQCYHYYFVIIATHMSPNVFKITRSFSETSLLLLVTLFILGGHNLGYFHNTLQVYQSQDNALFKLALLSILHGGLIFITLALLGFGRLLKALLAIILVFSAGTAYFTDTYNVIIDVDMIDNTLKTDFAEARDLVSMQQLLYILFLGLLPAWLVLKTPLKSMPWGQIIFRRLISLGAALILTLGVLVSAADFFATYIRENANLRYYSNPLAPLFEAGLYVHQEFVAPGQQTFQIIAPDAKKMASDNKPKLSIVVVGETLRADHFGLNGYDRNTTPLLAQEPDLINYPNVNACGTSTAHSLPCMFSYLERTQFNKLQANNMENALDILHKTGVQVVWIDNNSSAKGVADRVTYLDAKSPTNNTVCDPECRDIGMLSIAKNWLTPLPASDDKLIVLHQMGSHGPAYYKRYPDAFKQYTPICESNQLDSCSREEIINTYDNTVLYTDYFLSESIQWLKALQTHYEVSLLYISDHGESLGENGLYLHGYPYMFAPKAQIEVPMITWSSKPVPTPAINQVFSHDNLFHTLLGLYNTSTAVYKREMDILK